ncbi:hypothetical protein MTO96_042349 [Rhipicephalus appendiculatus]
METVLRQFLSTSMDPQKCPAVTGPDFSSLFNCQQWTLGGADAADDIRLQMDRGDTSSVGHGTGDMAVALISFLLLTQVCVVIKPLNKDAAAYFTDSNACEVRDMELAVSFNFDGSTKMPGTDGTGLLIAVQLPTMDAGRCRCG